MCINKTIEFMFTLKAVIIQDHIRTNSKLKACMHLPEEDPENLLHLALFWVSFLDLVFGCEARLNLPFSTTTILTSDWDKLESWNFVITYTIMFYFKIYKKIFTDMSIFLMTLWNIDFPTRYGSQIQHFGNFLIAPDRKEVFNF